MRRRAAPSSRVTVNRLGRPFLFISLISVVVLAAGNNLCFCRSDGDIRTSVVAHCQQTSCGVRVREKWGWMLQPVYSVPPVCFSVFVSDPDRMCRMLDVRLGTKQTSKLRGLFPYRKGKRRVPADLVVPGRKANNSFPVPSDGQPWRPKIQPSSCVFASFKSIGGVRSMYSGTRAALF